MRKFIALLLVFMFAVPFLASCEDDTTNSTFTDGSNDTTPTVPDGTYLPELLDDNTTYYADIEIEEYGTITVKLDQKSAPITCANFVSLAKNGFYDGLTFHRIISGFMIQGGDPNGNGTGGSGNNIKGEFTTNGVQNNIAHVRGVISMARSGAPNSASSQFFIMHEDSPHLNGQYAAFGHVTDGIEIVDEICNDARPVDNNGSILKDDQPVINKVTIRTKTTNTEDSNDESTPSVSEDDNDESISSVSEDNNDESTPSVSEDNNDEATPSVSEDNNDESTPSVSEDNNDESTPSVSEDNNDESTPSIPDGTYLPDLLDDDLTYYADIDIKEYGTITVKLDQKSAPISCANFVSLAKSGFYDGLTFHRIISGFMIQGGDPNGNGTGGSGNNIKGEFAANGVQNNIKHVKGVISMARAVPYNSASSQFFIMHEDAPHLDGQYAAFGHVTKGIEIVDSICNDANPVDFNGTITKDEQPVINKVTIRTEK